MTDVMTKVERSALMSRVKGRGNQSTEIKLLKLLHAAAIRGWRRHLDLPGRPDFAFPDVQVAIFVDGCFWHGCPRCYQSPKNNARFWQSKIEGNKRRDRRVTRELRRDGWTVLRIRECRLASSEDRLASKIESILIGRAPEIVKRSGPSLRDLLT